MAEDPKISGKPPVRQPKPTSGAQGARIKQPQPPEVPPVTHKKTTKPSTLTKDVAPVLTPGAVLEVEKQLKLTKEAIEKLKNGILLTGAHLQALLAFYNESGFEITPEMETYFRGQLGGKTPQEISNFLYEGLMKYIKPDSSGFTQEFLDKANGISRPTKTDYDFFALMLLLMDIAREQKDAIGQIAREEQVAVQKQYETKVTTLEEKAKSSWKYSLGAAFASIGGALLGLGMVGVAGTGWYPNFTVETASALSTKLGTIFDTASQMFQASGKFYETAKYDTALTEIEARQQKHNFNKDQLSDSRRAQAEIMAAILEGYRTMSEQIQTTLKAVGRSIV